MAVTTEVCSPLITLARSDGSARREKQGIERCEYLRRYGLDATAEAAVVCGASADFFCEECGWVCELCGQICSGDGHKLTEIRALHTVITEAIGETDADDRGDFVAESGRREAEDAVLDSAVIGGRR